MTAFWRLGVGSLLVLSCSSSGGDGDGFGGAGGGSNGDEWWCSCVSGISVTLMGDGSGTAPSARCSAECSDKGGVSALKPKDSALGTAECSAYCAKIDGAGCQGSPCAEMADFWCSVRASSCLEATKARLQCEAESVTVTCNENGWQASSGCGDFEELCSPADAGDQ